METKSVETESLATAKWLGRMSEGSKRSYGPTFNRFMTYVREKGGPFKEMTPDELVRYQRNSDNGSAYDILDLIQGWIGKMNARQSSKDTAYSIVKSFFNHNRATLPKDPSFIIRGDQDQVIGRLTIENIRDMVLSSNRCYRAIVLSMFQGGMDTSSMIYWSENGLESLKEQLRDDPETIRIELPGRMKRRKKQPFYPLIGRDAIEALKDWMEVRPPGHKQIFLTQAFEDKEKGIRKPVSHKSVRMYWLKHLEKIGLINRTGGKRSTRYGLNLHELRDVFRSQWEKSPAKASVAEFMMGHKVDPLEYNKACRDEDWVREEYLKALPLLQIMSSDTPFGKVSGKTVNKLQERIDELETQIEEMMPAFKFAQTMFKEKRDRDSAHARESSREPPIPIAQEV